MRRWSTPLVLRAAGLAVWALVVCTHVFGPPTAAAQGPLPHHLPAVLAEALTALLLLAFAPCLWFNLREAPVELPSPAHRWRLVAQLLAGLLVHTDLLYVVAGQAALVLEARVAWRWLALQTVALVLCAVLWWSLGSFDPLPAFAAAPAPLAFGVTLLSLLTWQTFAFSVGWLAAREARQRRALAVVHAQLVTAQQQLAEQSRLQERLRVSRELHDTLGHHLVAMQLQVDLARRVPAERRDAHLAAASEVSRGMLADLRRVVGVLRDEPPPDLHDALLAMQAALPEPRIHLQLDSDPAELPPARAHAVLRCVQEGVSNALRHGRARNLWVTLRDLDGGVQLTVRDDGRGAAEVHPGNGLTGMRERVAAAGGTLALHGNPGQGFAIEVVFGATAARERAVIRIVLADDQALVRAGLRGLLTLEPDFEVVAEAADGKAAVECALAHAPDLLLLDVRMPAGSGIEVLRTLRARQALPPTLLLTTFDDDEALLDGMRAGARGFLLKDVTPERLYDAIRRVARGERLFQPAVTERVLERVESAAAPPVASQAPEPLTPREAEILRLLAAGLSNKEIARALGTAEGTIKNHVSNVLAKLGVRDRTRAVLRAMQEGYL